MFDTTTTCRAAAAIAIEIPRYIRIGLLCFKNPTENRAIKIATPGRLKAARVIRSLISCIGESPGGVLQSEEQVLEAGSMRCKGISLF